MSGSNYKEVEEANARFYRAVESGTIEEMDEVWAHDDWVRCVHPGWDVISGWRGVRESWQGIFRSGQKLKISASSVSVRTSGDFAWVTCTEEITAFDEASFDSAITAATNLFIRREGRWLMVHHHASAVPMILADSSTDVIQ